MHIVSSVSETESGEGHRIAFCAMTSNNVDTACSGDRIISSLYPSHRELLDLLVCLYHILWKRLLLTGALVEIKQQARLRSKSIFDARRHAQPHLPLRPAAGLSLLTSSYAQ